MLEKLLGETDALIGRFVFDSWEQIGVVAGGLFTGLAVLYVVVFGYLLLMGRIQLSFAEWFPRLLRLAVVLALVTAGSRPMEWVFDLVTNGPNGLAAALMASDGSGESGVNSAVNGIWERGMTAASNIFAEAGFGITAWVFGLMVFVATAGLVLYVTFIVMLSKLAVAVLLALAPVFIALFLFDATRPLFEGWLRQLLSVALVPAFLYGLLALFVSIPESLSEELLAATQAEETSLSQVAPYVVVVSVSMLLVSQVRSWAAGVAGGFTLSHAISTRQVASVAAATGPLAGRLAKGTTKLAGSGVKRAKAAMRRPVRRSAPAAASQE